MTDIIKARMCKTKWLMPLGFAITVFLSAMSILLCFLRGFSGMENIWVFNIGADVVAVAVCAAIYFGCMMDSNGVNENTAMFSILVIVNAAALFLDECSWLLQGVARFAFLNRLVNALLFANGGVVIYLFSRYLGFTLDMNDHRLRTVKKVLHFLLLPDVLIKLANLFVPIYFSVDEAGVYRRERFFGFSYVYLGVVMFFFVVELMQSKASFRQKNAAVSFITIPLVNQLPGRTSSGRIPDGLATGRNSCLMKFGVFTRLH